MDQITDTADIRAKMLKLWQRVDENSISASEVRLHIGIARVILESLKVEMAASHLSQTHIPAVAIRPSVVKAARGEATPHVKRN